MEQDIGETVKEIKKTIEKEFTSDKNPAENALAIDRYKKMMDGYQNMVKFYCFIKNSSNGFTYFMDGENNLQVVPDSSMGRIDRFLKSMVKEEEKYSGGTYL